MLPKLCHLDNDLVITIGNNNIIIIFILGISGLPQVISVAIYYGPGPHWGTVRNKMSPGKVCKSCVLRSIYLYTHTVTV